VNHAALGGLRCLGPSGSYAWRSSECTIAGGSSAGSPLPGKHRSGALGGGGRPGHPSPGRRWPEAAGGGPAVDRSGRCRGDDPGRVKRLERYKECG
jgi:hypothetical protein